MSELEDQLHAVIAACDADGAWQLTIADRARYAAALLPLLPADVKPVSLRVMVQFYHLEHEAVGLLTSGMADDAQWQMWLGVVRRTIVLMPGRGQADRNEPADAEQEAWVAILRALPNYRYQSQLSTWMASVVLNTERSRRRYEQAEKRRTWPDPLDAVGPDDVPAALDNPESAAQTSALIEYITELLAAQPNQRLLHIFRLHILDDLKLNEVGRYIGLSPARTRVLLNQMRALLRADPELRAWLKHDLESGEPDEASDSAA